jgi:hypothetical protein
MAHTRRMLDKQGYMHTRACTRPRSQAPAYTHAHSHTDKCVIFIAFPLQQWFRERASILRYTYIACLVPRQKEKALACKDHKDTTHLITSTYV